MDRAALGHQPATAIQGSPPYPLKFSSKTPRMSQHFFNYSGSFHKKIARLNFLVPSVSELNHFETSVGGSVNLSVATEAHKTTATEPHQTTAGTMPLKTPQAAQQRYAAPLRYPRQPEPQNSRAVQQLVTLRSFRRIRSTIVQCHHLTTYHQPP